jgi:ketosteroid isomerase-like protein
MTGNVHTVKDIYAAFGRGDIPAILAQLAVDVVWEFEGPSSISFTGIRHGVPDASGFFTGIDREHTEPHLEIQSVIGSGDEVAAFGRYSATMKNTGKRVTSPLAHYWKFRDGKVARYVNYIDTAAFVEGMKA